MACCGVLRFCTRKQWVHRRSRTDDGRAHAVWKAHRSTIIACEPTPVTPIVGSESEMSIPAAIAESPVAEEVTPVFETIDCGFESVIAPKQDRITKMGAASSNKLLEHTISMFVEFPAECSLARSIKTESPPSNFKYMFPDGCPVEYYSSLNLAWVPGFIKVEAIQKQHSDSSGSLSDTRNVLLVMYTVVLHGTRWQEKHNVALNTLRIPFREAELVEIFSLRDGGQWLPGVIHGAQASGASTTGYRVFVSATGVILEKVPAARLRRRFPADMLVSVYEGCIKGWCDAVVECYESSAELPHDEEDSHISLDSWTYVTVKFDDSGEEKRVPSYLVLARSLASSIHGRDSANFLSIAPPEKSALCDLLFFMEGKSLDNLNLITPAV